MTNREEVFAMCDLLGFQVIYSKNFTALYWPVKFYCEKHNSMLSMSIKGDVWTCEIGIGSDSFFRQYDRHPNNEDEIEEFVLAKARWALMHCSFRFDNRDVCFNSLSCDSFDEWKLKCEVLGLIS